MQADKTDEGEESKLPLSEHSMQARKIAPALGVACLCVGIAGPEWPTRLTCPRPSCSIPSYDYRISPQAASFVTATGFSSLPVTPTGLATTDKRVSAKYFNITQTELKIDHCSISKISVVVFDDGKFVLSFRADQNAQFAALPQQGAGGRIVGLKGDVPISGAKELTLQTGQFKRNEFTVRARFLGATSTDAVRKVGGAVLAEIRPPEFMVQRSEGLDYYRIEQSPLLKDFHHLLDRVEIDFSYR